MIVDRFQPLRERFPDFSLNLMGALKATKVSQPYLYELFILHTQERQLSRLGKRINRVIWSRKRDDEKIELLIEAIVEFNCCLQRLRNINHDDANLAPLDCLYDDLVTAMPVDNLKVQLTIEFQWF